MNSDYLSSQHPTLSRVAFEMVDLVGGASGLVLPGPEGSVWMQHMEFADRSEDLADHLRSALVLGESRSFPSALAVTRTALEHHLLDRLLLLADRYEETIRPVDVEQLEQWEREFADKSDPWTADVTSVTRTSNGRALKIVRRGHSAKNSDGEVTEQISPYWVALDRYDAFTGHPDLQAATARPFSSVEELETWAKRNQAVYGTFLKWSSILWNLQLSDLVTQTELLQLQVHYTFLSAFAHATNKRRDSTGQGRPGGPPADHVLSELILLYACAIAIAELRAWGAFFERRPAMLEPLATDVQHRIAAATRTIDYFWFLGGTPQPFDFYQEANRRSHENYQQGGVGRSRVDPTDIPTADVTYYSNPIERLGRMHTGENEMMTGLSFPPAWPTLHW